MGIAGHEIDEDGGGRRDHSLRLYALLVLELWTRAVIEGRPARTTAPEARLA